MQPNSLGSCDIPLLPLLRPCAKKDDELLPIPPEVDSTAGPIMDPMFEHAFTHSPVVAEISLPHSTQRNRHPIGSPSR
jgi:hypothetical protein